MINNLNLIKPLLTFKNPDDFYVLYILKRKKDQLEGEKQNNQSVRTIKTYCISSVTYLEQRMEEIISLCEMFKARGYIHVSAQQHSNISLYMMELLAKRIRSKIINQKNLWDSVVGELKTKDKKWIVDIDTTDFRKVESIMLAVEACDPLDKDKIISLIPTKNGYHLLTHPFNVEQFRKSCLESEAEIHKTNPTLLYYPQSLTV